MVCETSQPAGLLLKILDLPLWSHSQTKDPSLETLFTSVQASRLHRINVE